MTKRSSASKPRSVWLCEERASHRHKWVLLLGHGVFASEQAAHAQYWNAAYGSTFQVSKFELRRLK